MGVVSFVTWPLAPFGERRDIVDAMNLLELNLGRPGNLDGHLQVAESAEPVLCVVCGNATLFEVTRRCNRCWELERRLEADPELALRLLLKDKTLAEARELVERSMIETALKASPTFGAAAKLLGFNHHHSLRSRMRALNLDYLVPKRRRTVFKK